MSDDYTITLRNPAVTVDDRDLGSCVEARITAHSTWFDIGPSSTLVYRAAQTDKSVTLVVHPGGRADGLLRDLASHDDALPFAARTARGPVSVENPEYRGWCARPERVDAPEGLAAWLLYVVGEPRGQ